MTLWEALAREHGTPWLNGPGRRLVPGYDHSEDCEVCFLIRRQAPKAAVSQERDA